MHKKYIVSIEFGTICGFRYPLGSWNAFPTNKGNDCVEPLSREAWLCVNKLPPSLTQCSQDLGSKCCWPHDPDEVTEAQGVM